MTHSRAVVAPDAAWRPERGRGRRAVAAAIGGLLALGACRGEDAVLLVPVDLTVAPASVLVLREQRVQLTATSARAPAGTALRWQSQDTSVFRLDTTTTGPHQVVGIGGRCVGTTTITVIGGGGAVTVPVQVTRGVPAGATVCLDG